MPVDITSELRFRTARSGGKGGQNVNKVETMVEGLFDISASSLLHQKQKELISEKLKTRINKEGILHVRSQAARSQLENKQRVIQKMNALFNKALTPEKPRKPTKPSKASREKRLQQKKIVAERKEGRRKDWQ
ncbi:MAG TPA: alternative ribosome rescue aminoacyl-tRNA hydrolase ArfB [Chitinophagaceae bacterium]|nr:alternative ribosome rescue aminoacyl-tRNA hydrolase ArfB [Chitinophagaceae bacterium]